MKKLHGSNVPYLSVVCILGFCCLWDYETLLMEKARFPGAAELIAGEFRRHSPEFHQWRIEDRLKKLKIKPDDIQLFDDLAVSYEKSGRTDLAIQTMLEKAELKPNLYETHANLGTFYIHAGEFEKGIMEIDRAIELNPDAHFGREIYQRNLVEYLISLQGSDGELGLPLCVEIGAYAQPTGFAKFLIKKRHPNAFAEDRFVGHKQYLQFEHEMIDAIKGVLGMMRFGNYDSPILLEAFAHLVHFQTDKPRHLATRALLKAALEVEDDEVKKRYREMAKASLENQTGGNNSSPQLELAEVEEELFKEIQAAEEWFEEITKNEKEWISAGLDVESEYAKVYFREPSETKRLALDRQKRIKILLTLATCAGIIVLGAWILAKKRRVRARERLHVSPPNH